MARPLKRRALPIVEEPSVGMVPLPGDRRDDCAHYSGCLTVLAKEHPHAEDGRCSLRCDAYVLRRA